jgi:hypothetical protein
MSRAGKRMDRAAKRERARGELGRLAAFAGRALGADRFWLTERLSSLGSEQAPGRSDGSSRGWDSGSARRDGGVTRGCSRRGGAAANRQPNQETHMANKSTTFPDLPSKSELEYIRTLPTHHPTETRHYVRRLDGIEGVGARAASALQSAGDVFAVPGVTPATLKSALGTIAKLEPIEQALYPYYRRTYENRLEADGEVMSALYKLWRMAQASGDPGLIARFQFIGDWIARHHGHGVHTDAAPAPEPAPTAGAGNGSSGASATGGESAS